MRVLAVTGRGAAPKPRGVLVIAGAVKPPWALSSVGYQPEGGMTATVGRARAKNRFVTWKYSAVAAYRPHWINGRGRETRLIL